MRAVTVFKVVVNGGLDQELAPDTYSVLHSNSCRQN